VPVYFVANSKIVDRDLLEEYQKGTRPVLGAVAGAELTIADNSAEVLEGEPAGTRVIVVKFESEESFRDFYNSPEYQAVIGSDSRPPTASRSSLNPADSPDPEAGRIEPL
jgi:uncharacterized protein (DUF1330 family)